MISPFIGREFESSLWPPRTTAKTTFLTTRGEKEARELLRQSYEPIEEMDERMDDFVHYYDHLQEELSEIKKLNPSEIRNRIEASIYYSFFANHFMCSVEMGRSYILEIIGEYKNTGQKIYLRE